MLGGVRLQEQLYLIRSALYDPCQHRRGLLGEADTFRFETDRLSRGRFNDEAESVGEYGPALLKECLIVGPEESGDRRRQAVPGHSDPPAQNLERPSLACHRTISARDLIVVGNSGIQPGQASESVRLVDAVMRQHGTGDIQDDIDLGLGSVSAGDNKPALVLTSGLRGYLHAKPERLNPPLGHVDRLLKGASVGTDPFEVETSQGRPRDRPAAFQVRELDVQAFEPLAGGKHTDLEDIVFARLWIALEGGQGLRVATRPGLRKSVQKPNRSLPNLGERQIRFRRVP